jgi:hypothetical protein
MNSSIPTALLRDPTDIVARCERPEGLRDLATTSLGCIAAGAAVFGGVVGSFRGGLQIAYSSAKLPIALFAALVVCVPAFFAVATSIGKPLRFGAVAALTLAASARAALVLMGLAPILWLAVDGGLDYHASVMLASCMYLASGLTALGIVWRGLGGTLRGFAAAMVCAGIFLGVLGQTAWMLRPFLGRPSQESIPFVRTREGTFADAVVTSSRSAAGIYDDDRGPQR